MNKTFQSCFLIVILRIRYEKKNILKEILTQEHNVSASSCRH